MKNCCSFVLHRHINIDKLKIEKTSAWYKLQNTFTQSYLTNFRGWRAPKTRKKRKNVVVEELRRVIVAHVQLFYHVMWAWTLQCSTETW